MFPSSHGKRSLGQTVSISQELTTGLPISSLDAQITAMYSSGKENRIWWPCLNTLYPQNRQAWCMFFSDLLSGHFVHCMSCKEPVMFQQCNEAVACSFCIQRNYIHLFTRKLQALIYAILPPTTAITDYAIGLEKLLANGQFFVGAQMVLSL